MEEKYNAYTVADFLDDADFIAYIKRDLRAEEWQSWLQTGPPNRNAFEEASLYLRTVLNAERIRPASDTADIVLAGITREIDRLDGRKGKLVSMKRVGVAAACVILLIGLGWYYYTDRIVIATGYAQQQLVTLPDHSTVMLNANSSLSYYRAYGMHRKEVWLKGEGLFDIRHDAADHFTAHAGRLSVEVMGTRFTIRQRRDKIAVALLEGKISIREGQSAEALILRPGEAVNYEDTLARLSKIVKLPNQPQAWVNHAIQANGMTVQDIIDTYEDTYGYKIILADPSQAAKKIDGSLSLETEEGVLYTLANILNANIHREGKEIYLRPK